MQAYFQLDPDIVHLNHAAVSPWPVVTRDAVIAFAEENTAIGSKRYLSWIKTEQQLKDRLRQLINASSIDEIALLKNTSEGLSIIAQGLKFRTGDNIVIPAEEFPSNKVVWQALQAQGVELRMVPLQDTETPELALLSAMDKHTRLLSCSTVQFARGLRLDVDIIGNACHDNNTLFCVDAIQSLGAIPFDAQACHADFVVADGHKWMCGPEGTALFYCRKDVQQQLTLRQHGWHMLKQEFFFSDDLGESALEQQFADSAQRFECGSPNMTGIAALNASLGLLLEIGIENISQGVITNAGYLIQQLQSMADIELLSAIEENRYAGIVTFSKSGTDSEQLYQALMRNNVLCANRGGGIRFSPHFYTETSAMDKALRLVADFKA